MRLDAIVRRSFRTDRFDVKRKPHSPVHPPGRLFSPVLLVLVLSGAAIGLRAQETTEGGKPESAKVASLDPKALTTPVATGVTMTLRSVSGQEIEARLLSALGDSIRIERVDDGREFTIPIGSLDEYTAAKVRQWIDKVPGAVDYSLSIEASRSLAGSSSFMSAGREMKTADWSYRVRVTNLSRNLIAGAMLEYRIVYDDEVDIARTVVAPGKGANQQEGQLVDLPEMQYNDEIEFDTPPLTLHTYEYVPQRGEREYSRDSIKGLWVRIVKNGEILCEYQSHPGAMASLSWDNEEKLEIRVTNRFRDQFGAGEK